MPAESRATIGGAIFIYGASCALLGVAPVLAGLFADQLHLTLSRVAWLLAIEQTGGVAGALIGYWLTPVIRWRYLILTASLVTVASNLLSGGVEQYATLMLFRFLSGLGMVLTTMVAACTLARSHQMVRVFGAGLFLSVLINAIQIWMTEMARAHFGYRAALYAGVPWYLVCAAVVFLLPLTLGPAARPTEAATSSTGRVKQDWLGLTGLAGLALFGISVNGVWGFVERMGTANGLSAFQIGSALEVGTLGGLLGGVIPTVLGARGGIVRMVGITTMLFMASLFVITRADSAIALGGGVCVLMSTWAMGLAYYMALASGNDPSGRYTRLMNFATVLAQAIGPLLAGLVTRGRLSNIFFAMPVPSIIAFVLVVLAHRARCHAAPVAVTS